MSKFISAKIAALAVATALFAYQPISASGAALDPGKVSVPLPAEIKERGKLIVGTYCDYPPFGFTGADQTPQGTDPDLARYLAELAFGDANAVEFQCVKSDQRISFLQAKRIDMLASTLGVTIERAKVIEFSKPYFASTTLFLARKGEEFKTFKDIQGQPVAVSSGTPYVTWLQKCQPNIELVQYDSIPSQVEALSNGRVKAILTDSTLVLPLAAKNPKFVATGPEVNEQGYQWAFGVRQGDKEMQAWLNGAIDVMQEKDVFWTGVEKWIPEKVIQDGLLHVVRRPGQTPDYSVYLASTQADPACPKE